MSQFIWLFITAANLALGVGLEGISRSGRAMYVFVAVMTAGVYVDLTAREAKKR